MQADDAGQPDNLSQVIEEQTGRQQDNDGADVGVTLPPHMRCCSHTPNLVATCDAERALSEPAYKKIYLWLCPRQLPFEMQPAGAQRQQMPSLT